MRRMLLASALLMAGCAYNAERTANVTGNEVSVTVNNVWNANQALLIADKHCHQYGKAARPSGHNGDYAYTFDCIPI